MADKYLNTADGKTYVIISDDGFMVSFKLESGGKPHYLGKSEFDKRFQLVVPMNIRQERIERLIADLTYEIQRGIMEKDIEEHLQYDHVEIPSREADAFIHIQIRVKPVKREILAYRGNPPPGLRIVK
jgi:hypothetical protein